MARVPAGSALGALILALGVALVAAVAGWSLGCGRLVPRSPPLPRGAVAPDFALVDHQGARHALAELVARGPAVLVFYRGHW
jgi:hypothetical protein